MAASSLEEKFRIFVRPCNILYEFWKLKYVFNLFVWTFIQTCHLIFILTMVLYPSLHFGFS